MKARIELPHGRLIVQFGATCDARPWKLTIERAHCPGKVEILGERGQFRHILAVLAEVFGAEKERERIDTQVEDELVMDEGYVLVDYLMSTLERWIEGVNPWSRAEIIHYDNGFRFRVYRRRENIEAENLRDSVATKRPFRVTVEEIAEP